MAVTNFGTPISSPTLLIDKSDSLSFKWLNDLCALREEHGLFNSFPDILGFKALLLPNDSLFSLLTAAASTNLVFLTKLASEDRAGKVCLLGLLDFK